MPSSPRLRAAAARRRQPLDIAQPHLLGIAELASAYRTRSLSPLEVTDHLLERIDRLEPSLHAFVGLCPERARAAARAAGETLAGGNHAGPLTGIPYAAKDLFDVAGMATGAGSHLLEDNIAARDAAVIGRLSAAGMVLIGKTHTVQFAYGGVGLNTDLGTPHNPWNAEHCAPGGSSSGSAVATAARLVPAALGSDTGGSVRIPAALCGISGLKTTVGQVSRAGVWPLSHSLDSVGPLARSVADCALLYEAMQGADPDDPSTTGRSPQRVLPALAGGVRGLRLRVAESLFFDDADPQVVAAFESALDEFSRAGADVARIEFPLAAEAQKLNPRGLVIAAEAYHHNRRLVEQHFDELDPVVAQRMKHGRDIAAPDYIATTLAWAKLRGACENAMADFDALLVPTTPIPALPVQALADNLDVYTRHNMLYLRNTAVGNILGLCGVSVPCGFTRAGMPVGLMVYARAFQETTALRVGHAFQQATDWHQRAPDLGWTGA